MTLTFNIIYTPGTVKYLSFLSNSLLQWSNCRFRLVSNGCLPEEVGILKRISNSKSQFEFEWIPTPTPIKHSDVLNFLQKKEKSPYFCFMDSDILTDDDISLQWINEIKFYSGIFSGSPLWCKPEEQELPQQDSRIRGWYNRTHSNICLGNSYLAIYDNRILSKLINEYGIDFRRYHWSEVPEEIKKQLVRLGLDKMLYDTGKLLNIIFALNGFTLNIQESEHIHHIGGMSNRIFKHESVRRSVKDIEKKLRTELDENTSNYVLIPLERRDYILQYFGQLLQSVFNENPQPLLFPEIEDKNIIKRIQNASDAILSLIVKN